METKDRVLIIGGGIGGLTCAVAMQRAGIPALVVEQAPELREVGAGLGLWTNAVKLLQRLGIGGELWAHASPMGMVEICSSRGKALARTDMQRLSKEYGADSYVAHRAELHAAIARKLDPGNLVLGGRCTVLRQDESSVTAHVEGMGELRGRLLVGADGLRSAVRAALWGEAPPRYSGETCYRGVCHLSLKDEVRLREVDGPGQRCGISVLDRERVYWWTTEVAPEGERDEPLKRRAHLLERFRGWPYGIGACIEATAADAILRNDLYDRPALPRWSQGRVTLLGDAAHPTTPNLGQGACMAIEDAVVLTRMLAAHRDHERAFAAYEAERRERTAGIVRLSARYGRLGQLRNPVAVRLREWALRATPAPVMEKTLRQQIGYDAGEVPAPCSGDHAK